jgi:hypothetical protein
MAKKLTTTIYITEKQQQLLKELNRHSKVPVAEYIREGIDLVLQKYNHRLPDQNERGLGNNGQKERNGRDPISQKGAESL